jgi:O-antigen/teichoic acid export membrane protein
MDEQPPAPPAEEARSLPRRFRRNVISNYANTGTKAVLALVMTPVLVNGLGTEAFGVWTLVGSFTFYLKLLDFGFGHTALKAVAEYEARGDRSGMREAISTMFWILVLPGLVALLLGAAIAVLFPELFGVTGELSTESQILILIVTFELAISIPSDTFGGALLGLERFDLVNLTVIVVAIAQAVAWAIVLVAGGGLVELGIVTFTISTIGPLSRYLLLRRLIPGTNISLERFDRGLVKPFAAQSLWFSVTYVGEIVRTRVDVLVVGLVVSVSGAGIYGVAQKLTTAVIELIEPVTRVFFPHLASLAVGEQRRLLQDSLLTGTRITLGIAAPVCLTLAVLAPQTLDAWVGEGFDQAALVIVYLCSAIAMSTVFRTGLWMVQGAGHVAWPAILIIAEALLNLGLSIWLGAQLGLDGVALGTLIATAVATIVAVPLMCRQFGITTTRFLYSLLRAHLPPAATALVVAWLLTRLPLSGLLPVVGAMAAVAGSYVAVFAATGLTSGERRELRSRLRTAPPAAASPSP